MTQASATVRFAASTSRRLALCVATCLTALSALPQVARAGPEWFGGSGTSGNWSDHLNWLYGDRPGFDGTDKVFFSEGDRKTSVVDGDYWIARLIFGVDVFNDPPSMTLNGTRTLKISSCIQNEYNKSQVINVPIQFSADGSISNYIDSNNRPAMTFGGSIDTDGNTVTLGPSSYNLYFNGGFAGNGSVTIDGPGWVVLNSSSSMSGGWEIDKGVLNYAAGPQLGAAGSSITFNQTDTSYVARLYRSTTGTTTVPIAFLAGEGQIETPAGLTHTLTGATRGNGTFAKLGDGTLVLSGASGAGGDDGFTGQLSVGAGTLKVIGAPRLPDNRVTVNALATLAIDPNIADHIGSLAGAGTIQLGTNASLKIGKTGYYGGSQNGTGTFSGVLNGVNVTISKYGTGTLSLSGASTYSGQTNLFDGLFSADNLGAATSATGSSSVSVENGATLTGDGAILGQVTVQSGGTIAPSLSTTPGIGLGSLSVGSLVVSGSSSALNIQLSYSGVNDSLNVTGDASLAGTLNLSNTLGVPITDGRHKIMSIAGTRTGAFQSINGMSQTSTIVLAVTYDAHGVYVTPASPGDASLDGTVNFDDLLAVAQNYGKTTGGTWSLGDFNGDAAVDFADLLALAQHYNGSAINANLLAGNGSFESDWVLAQSLVPEPSMLLIAATPMLTKRRRRE